MTAREVLDQISRRAHDASLEMHSFLALPESPRHHRSPGSRRVTDYDATPALLAAANESIRVLAEENRALMAANADLNAELTSLRRELDDKARA